MTKQIILLFVLLMSNVYAQAYRANKEKLPKLELGAGALYGETPHYPGSDEVTKIFLPFPTVIYRGEHIRSDEDGGIRGRIFHSDRWELNLSIGGALPVSSKDNDEREGMPKLHTILEFGPGLIYHFVPKDSKSPFKLSLNIPLRLAISTNVRDTYQRGVVFNPLLYGFYEATKKATAFFGLSARWGTQSYHDYLYSVEKQYVRTNRIEYKAESGYVLTTASLGMSYEFGDYSMFTGVAYHDASDNSNSNSPLFVQNDSLSWVVGFVWWFYESD